MRETKKVEQIKETDFEVKKRLRRAQIEDKGPLHLDDKYKEDGYRYRPVNITPGNVAKFQSMGYEVVSHEIKSGNGALGTPEVSVKGSVEIEVGRSSSLKAVWMRTTEENAQILRSIEDDNARAQDSMMYRKNPGIPADQLVGSITKEK